MTNIYIPLLETFTVVLLLQFGCLLAQQILLVTLFELVPYLLGKRSKFLVKEFFEFQFLRGMYTAALLSGMVLVFSFYGEFGIFSIEGLHPLVQGIILYLLLDFTIYLSHLAAHKLKIPFISKAHKYHHSITENLNWTNARKEHLLILTSFTFIFFLLLFVFFKTSLEMRLSVVTVYLILLSFSHFRIPFSIPYLNKIFLFPGDHIRHHTDRSGPYGTSLSLFDTIFGTRYK